MSNRVELRDEFLNKLINSGKTTVSRSEVKEICKSLGITAQWFVNDPENRVVSSSETCAR